MNSQETTERSNNASKTKTPRFLKAAFGFGVFCTAAGALFAIGFWAKAPDPGLPEQIGGGIFADNQLIHKAILQRDTFQTILGSQILVVVVPSLIGLVLAIAALITTHKAKKTVPLELGRTWSRKAWASLGLLAFTLIILVFLNSIVLGRTRVRPAFAIFRYYHLSPIQSTLISYLSEKGSFPLGDKWNDALLEQDTPGDWKKLLPSEKCTYILNKAVAGKPEPSRPVVLVFEGNKEGWNQSGDASLLPQSPIHGVGYFFLLTDGRSIFCRKDKLADLNWE